MRFTGMRIPLQDGTALQGRGIVPDHVVHPTLEGVRAGRDEILDAALQLAAHL
jgi:C-terminal processing protease CtpA/Prc